MPIIFKCGCGKYLSVRSQHAGRKVRCPSCKEVNVIPDPSVQRSRPLARVKTRVIQKKEFERLKKALDEDRPEVVSEDELKALDLPQLGEGAPEGAADPGPGEDVIGVRCDCGKKYKVPAAKAGSKFTCKKCGKRVRVPQSQKEPRPPSQEDAVQARGSRTSGEEPPEPKREQKRERRPGRVERNMPEKKEKKEKKPRRNPGTQEEGREEGREEKREGKGKKPSAEVRLDLEPIDDEGEPCPGCGAAVRKNERICHSCGRDMDKGTVDLDPLSSRKKPALQNKSKPQTSKR